MHSVVTARCMISARSDAACVRLERKSFQKGTRPEFGLKQKDEADVQSPQRMELNDFGDSLAFLLVPPEGQGFHSSRDVS